jgi:hypothetical protein
LAVNLSTCSANNDIFQWNISCHSSAHPTIAKWLDKHLVDIWMNIPFDVPVFTEFPEPERLSSRARNSQAVTSGLTKASPVSHYLQSLVARHSTTTKIQTVVRNAWRQTPPVQSVVYTFNKGEYPLPHLNAPATALTKDSAVAASGITAGTITTSVQQVVDRKLTDLETSRQNTDSTFTSRMNHIEDTMSRIQGELDQISDTVTDRVLQGLQKAGGLLFNQDKKIDLLLEQLMQLLPMVEIVLGLPSSTRPLSNTESESPSTKIRKLDNTLDMTVVRTD